MSLELTDAKRYELEKDNVTAIVLDANRRQKIITEERLAEILNIDTETVQRLITALRNDEILK